MRTRERWRLVRLACWWGFLGMAPAVSHGQPPQIEIRQPSRPAAPDSPGPGNGGSGGGGHHGGGHHGGGHHGGGHHGGGHHGHHHHHHHHHGHGAWGYPWYRYGLNPPIFSPGWASGGYYPSYGSGYPFTGVYGSPWLYLRPGHGFGHSGNVVQPGPWVGPQPWQAAPLLDGAALRGLVAPVPAGALPNAAGVVIEDQDPEVAEIHRRVDALKASTPLDRDRADRLIAQGDSYFADQRFGAASGKYRDAVAKAPDYPEAHFRLAHCYVAIARFNLALTRFLMALELAGSAERVNFSLAELYRGDKLAKQHHLEQLKDAIAREPQDGGLVFLLAISLHYDQQPFEARAEFARAKQMPGAHQRYVHHFLPAAPIAEPE